MRSTTHHLSISTARADALFVSALQRSQQPSATQIRYAIATAIREFGARGCATRVAQEYGDHPELAALRMRWARAVVEGHAEEKRVLAVQREGQASGIARHSMPPACCAA